MNTVNGICSDVYRTVKAKGHIRSIDIIVNRLWQMEDIQSLLPQKVRGFLSSVSSQNHQAVQAQLIICLFHGLYLVQPFLIRHTHQLKRLAGCPQYSAASGQNSGKILAGKHPVISIDQALVAVHESIHFKLVHIVRQPFHHAPHGSVQRLTVSAAGQ